MIYWDLILKSKDICGELERLYQAMSLRALADYLGVSKDALRQKLKECGVPLKPRGGSFPRITKDQLPSGWFKMDPEQLCALTGYSLNYSRKLIREARNEQRGRRRKKESSVEGSNE